MPHINFKNVNQEVVVELIEKITPALSKIIECPTDWITFYNTEAIAYIDNVVEESTCFVSVDWFKRSDEVKREVAMVLDDELRALGKEEIIIYFNELENENYFENKEQF